MTVYYDPAQHHDLDEVIMEAHHHQVGYYVC